MDKDKLIKYIQNKLGVIDNDMTPEEFQYHWNNMKKIDKHSDKKVKRKRL